MRSCVRICVTCRNWMWSCVCDRCSSSASLFLRSLISCSSRSSCPSARLTACFSWSLISRISSERSLSMERMSSVKMLSVSSTAVCAERCYTHSTGSSMSLRAALLSISCCSSAQTHLMRLHSRSQLLQLFLSLLNSLLMFHLCLLQKPLFTETH